MAAAALAVPLILILAAYAYALTVSTVIAAGVVAAAGNQGKDDQGHKVYGQIHSPGIEPAAITVGATNTFGTQARGDDAIATFSSRGPTRSYWTDTDGVKHHDNLIKPDLAAPGNKIVGAEANNSFLILHNPTLFRLSPFLKSALWQSEEEQCLIFQRPVNYC